MSTQNLPGPYWQDDDDAAYRRRPQQDGRPRRQSPWDNGGFRRGDERSSDRAGRSSAPRGSRHGGGSGGLLAAGRQALGSQRGRQAAGSRGLPSQGQDEGRRGLEGGRGLADRFSQTADDLRKRFGMLSSAGRNGGARAGDEDLWEDGSRTRATRGRDRNGAGAIQNASRAFRSQGGGYRGTRRAAGGAGAYGDYRGGRTAVRDRDFWTGDQAGTRAMRTRIAERTGNRRYGGGGGGRGGWGGRGGRGGGSGNFKESLVYGSWWRHWTLKKVAAVLGFAFAGFILLCIGLFFLLYSLTPIPTATSEAANFQSSTVYLANGHLLGTFNNGQTRQVLTAGEIPAVMTEAMTAAEDRNFYHEGGISVTGLMRSAYDDVFGSGNLQGGSTITMQYAKNNYAGVDSGQNISTKLKEIFIAMKLAHSRSKVWVMTNYLNTVSFGPTEIGLGAAAENFFNINLTKPGATLTVPQAAMLAAMPNAPGAFDPTPGTPGYGPLVARWQYVLGNMVRDGNISSSTATKLCAYCDAKQAQTAFSKYVKISSANITSGPTGYKGYLMDMVTRELEAPKQYGGYGLTQKELDTGGYTIKTTFSMGKTDALASTVNGVTSEIKAADGGVFPGYDWVGSVLENVQTGAIIAVDGGPGYGVKNCDKTNVSCFDNRAEFPEEVGSSSKPYVLATAVSEGMNVMTSTLNGFEPLAIPYAPAGSSQAEITKTEGMLSRLTAPAGHNLNTDNATFAVGQTWYKVFNEQGEDLKALQVNAATALSSDAAYEDLAHRVGIDNVIAMAAKLGVGQNPFNENCPIGGTVQQMKACSDLTGKDGLVTNFSTNPKLCNVKNQLCGSPQITFGASPLTPVEQASTFATFANGGYFNTPHVIASVYRGTVKLKAHLRHYRALPQQVANDVDYALSFDNNMNGATAEGSINYRRGGIIGKTGTLGTGQSANTAWFVGATPHQYSLATALYTQLGGGTKETLNNLPGTGGTPGEFGGAWPATIFNNYMFKEFPSQSFAPVSQVFPVEFTEFTSELTGRPVQFTRWNQVPKQPQQHKCFMIFGHSFGNCQNCPNGNGHGRGQQQCNGTPNPTTSTCPPFDPACNTTTSAPVPSPTLPPAPTPTPTPTPNPTTSTTAGAALAEEASLLTVVPPGGG